MEGEKEWEENGERGGWEEGKEKVGGCVMVLGVDGCR